MNETTQLSFNFDDISSQDEVQQKKESITIPNASTEPQNESPDTELKTTRELSRRDMKRAILAWLIPQKPSGMGLNVPTKVSKYRADIAAFWSSPAKKRLMAPDKTVIVEIRRNREQCWPDCSRQEELLPLLREKKNEKASMEAMLRETEPDLKDGDTLFPEFENWNYKLTKNRAYHKCLRQLEEIEHALYKGSRFEQIRRAYVADYLYLAVPTGTVAPEELADGWGLININPDMTAELVKKAEKWDCTERNKLHLIQHIAAACQKSLLFSLGMNTRKNGQVSFLPIPKRRRARKSISI